MCKEYTKHKCILLLDSGLIPKISNFVYVHVEKSKNKPENLNNYGSKYFVRDTQSGLGNEGKKMSMGFSQ